MPFVVERKATEEDRERLEAAARRYLKIRRMEPAASEDPLRAVWMYLSGLSEGSAIERRLWLRAAKRALRSGVSDQIDGDHVGYSVDK